VTVREYIIALLSKISIYSRYKLGVRYEINRNIKQKGRQHGLCLSWRIPNGMDWNQICRVTSGDPFMAHALTGHMSTDYIKNIK